MNPATLRVVTCHQPAYLPWAGLFHKMALSDVFVVMDSVDHSRTGLQNRNRIKGPRGAFWLSVPIARRSSASLRLNELVLSSDDGARDWQRRHWRSLQSCYSRARYWRQYAPMFEEVYTGRKWTGLVELNVELLVRLKTALGIRTELVRLSELGCEGRKSRLVMDACRRTSASVYVSGTNGHDYLREQEFLAEGTSVFYQSYRSPAYRQRFGGFAPDLSIVDLLFNLGSESTAVLLRDNVTRKAIAESLARHGRPAVLETAAEPAGGVTLRPARTPPRPESD